MKKLFTSTLAILIGIATFAQPVKDMAVIPIGVTLSSIMRLNVKSGGNIEFVVSTMDQYTTGIGNTAATTTIFDVYSSVKWDVYLYADAGNLTGTEVNTNTLAVAFLGYTPSKASAASVPIAAVANTTVAAAAALTNTSTTIIFSNTAASSNAGTVTGLQVQWVLGRAPATSTNLLGSAPDRYTVNAYLHLATTATP